MIGQQLGPYLRISGEKRGNSFQLCPIQLRYIGYPYRDDSAAVRQTPEVLENPFIGDAGTGFMYLRIKRLDIV